MDEHTRRYHRERMAKRRARWFSGKVCVVCGSTDRLQLDHIDPRSKHATLMKGSSIWSWSQARCSAELAKCQVLCHTHHVEKTRANREYAYGEKNGSCKLSDSQVAEILSSSESGVLLAKRYSVSRSQISRIKLGQNR